MDWKECRALILQDYNRMRNKKLKQGSFVKYFIALVRSESFKVSFWFRILTFIRSKKMGVILYYPLRLYYQHVSHVTGIQLPINTKVGGALCLFILVQL